MSTNSELALDQLMSPLLGHLERFKGVTTLRGILDQRNPTTLATLAAEGVNAVKARFAASLRADTVGLLDEWLNVLCRGLDGGRAAWTAADAYERRGLLDGVITGATSQETQVGAALGSIFGPIGTVVGGALGGIIAGGRIDEQAQSALAELDAWWERGWASAADQLAAGALRAHLERDLDAPPQLAAGPATGANTGSGGLVLVLGAGLAIGLFAIGWWVRSSDSDSRRPSTAASASASSRTAPSSSGGPAQEPPATIIGTWVSGAGDEITAMSAGKAVALVMKKPAAGSTYFADETVATLAPTTDPTTFTAEVLVRPSLPAGMKLDAAAAARCQELWTEARGRPLAARLDGRRLVVDVVKLAVDPGALELAAGRVVGCRKLDDTKAARAVLTLTRR